MNKAMKVVLFAALAVAMSGATMAQGTSHICAYVNDNVDGQNFVEGYKVGPGSATAYVGPYPTNGSGIGTGFYSGGLGAARVEAGDLYGENAASDNITHFTINKTDCALTMDTTLYPSGDTGTGVGDGLAITPDGRTMFVGSTGDDHIYSHTIAANGSLGAPFTEASTPDYSNGIEVSPDGRTLVVSYLLVQKVCAYPISGGHLGTPNCQSTVGEPGGVSIDPASACVYAGEANFLSEVAAFTLTGGVLGVPTDYDHFGPAHNSNSVLVNWDNTALYVSNQGSAKIATGLIASGCKLTFQGVTSDGISGSDFPSQIAQAKIAHGYVVTGDFSDFGTPSMGIFRAAANGRLTPLGSGQFPLMNGAVDPETIVAVGSAD